MGRTMNVESLEQKIVKAEQNVVSCTIRIINSTVSNR